VAEMLKIAPVARVPLAIPLAARALVFRNPVQTSQARRMQTLAVRVSQEDNNLSIFELKQTWAPH